MQCWVWQDERWCKEKSLLHALGLGVREIVSVVGAGGKTSTVCRLAREYREAERPCVIMTTTHMLYPTGETLHSRLPEGVQGRQADVYWVGQPCENGRIQSPAGEALREIFSQDFPVLIEADGSKGFPCKVPAEHEPVLLRETTYVCGVLGLDALGQSIGSCCHRPELTAEFLGKSIGDVLDVDDLALIASGRRGIRKGVDPGCSYTVVLNKADDDWRREQAARVVELLMRQGIGRVVMTCHI